MLQHIRRCRERPKPSVYSVSVTDDAVQFQLIAVDRRAMPFATLGALESFTEFS